MPWTIRIRLTANPTAVNVCMSSDKRGALYTIHKRPLFLINREATEHTSSIDVQLSCNAKLR